MATFVQGTGAQSIGSVDSIGIGYASDVTAGNLLVAVAVSSGKDIPSTAISDSAGHFWAVSIFWQRQSNPPAEIVAVFSTVAQLTGPVTVTLDATGSDYQTLGIGEFSPAATFAWGVNLATRIDGAVSNDNGDAQTGPAVSANLTTAGNGVVIAALSNASTSFPTSMTPRSGWTQFFEAEDVTNMPLSAIYRLTTPGTYSEIWDFGGNTTAAPWCNVVTGFLEVLANPEPDIHFDLLPNFPKRLLSAPEEPLDPAAV
jgi:hypothetical protein